MTTIISKFKEVVKIYFLLPDQLSYWFIRHWSTVRASDNFSVASYFSAHDVPLVSFLCRNDSHWGYDLAFVHAHVSKDLLCSSYWSASCHFFFLQYFVRSRCVTARLNFLANFATGLLFLPLRLLLRDLLAIIYPRSTHPLVLSMQSLLKT